MLTLTLGIAGNSVIFSVINATLLRPLAYPGPHRLVIISWQGQSQDQSDVSAPAFFLLKKRARSFSSITALYPAEVGVNITANGPQYVRALSVSHDFFRTFGVPPEVGRTFSAEDDEPNAPRAVVLSYELWSQRFSGDPSALEQEMQINGANYRIVGVMPKRFLSHPAADIWLPLQLSAANAAPGSNYRVIARLNDGVSRQQSQYELDGLAQEYNLTYLPQARKRSLIARDLQTFLVDPEREKLAILFAAVGFVFLIACTNVAVLILVRGAAGAQETAVRAALGPPRGRLLVSLLTESLLLSVIASVLGLILAKECLPLIVRIWPANLPLVTPLSIDWHVALFTLGLCILSPPLFGLAPAVKLARVDLAKVLVHTSRALSASAEQVRAVRLLVFGQMSLTVILLAGTMLLVKSLLHLYSTALGFDPEHVVVAQLSLAGDRYRTTIATNRLMDQVVRQLESAPGVVNAAGVTGLPLENGLNLTIHPVDLSRDVDHADEYRPVTPDYFKTLRIPVRSGRVFLTTDIAGSPPVAVINETMARRWWPDASAIDHIIKFDEKLGPEAADVPRRIVGVVSDIREKGPGKPAPATVYIPISQTPDNINAFVNKVFLTSIVVRASRDIDLSTQVRNAVQSADPNLPLASFRSFDQIVERSLAKERFLVVLTVAFGGFALLLTVVGIQGVLNYQVNLRSREIAVRMAVGATPAHILRMVVGQGTRLISLAVLVGLAGAFVIRGLLGGLLYNSQSTSLIVIVSTALMIGLVATLISLLAAVRAASIDPMAVLRNE